MALVIKLTLSKLVISVHHTISCGNWDLLHKKNDIKQVVATQTELIMENKMAGRDQEIRSAVPGGLVPGEQHPSRTSETGMPLPSEPLYGH